jgi:hypothetical protein
MKNKTGKEMQLTGNFMEMNDVKGTVTMLCGETPLTVIRGNGYFTPAGEIPREHTKEYALEAAQKLFGQNGKVYFTQKDGEYRGKILEITPAYAIQALGQKGSTLIIHRL